MADFQRVATLKTWVIGSLESDTGSEYLFGFDPNDGLVWLEREGAKYGPQDAVWKQAEEYIRTSSMVRGEPVSIPVEFDDDSYTVPVASDDRPRTVTRSAASSDYALPEENDPRIVGDLTVGGRDVPDEDIAAQAEAFLQEWTDGGER